MKQVAQIGVVILCLFMFGSVFGQDHEMFLSIPEGLAFINEIVMGDTTETGERADLDRVYVLERGGTWFFNGPIINTGWALNLKASDGEGAKPVLYNIKNPATGEMTVNVIEQQGDVYMENIHYIGYMEIDPAAYDEGISGVLIYNTAPGVSIELYGCVLTGARSQIIRSNAAPRLVKFQDCIFPDATAWPYKSIWQPRLFDNRDAGADSIIVINNTMINHYGKILRRRSSTAPVHHITFEHNTIINQMGRGGVLGLGLVDGDVNIKNNLFIDAMVEAADTNSTRQNDFLEHGELWGDDTGWGGKARHAWIYHTKTEGDMSQWTVENNYWCTTPGLQAAYDEIVAQGWNPGNMGSGTPKLSLFVEQNNLAANPANAFIQEAITLNNVTDHWGEIAKFFATPMAQGGAYPDSDGDDNKPLYPGYDKRSIQYYTEEMDCAYPTSLAAYSGSTDGFPVGDLNWFPDKKAEWEDYVPVDSRVDITDLGGIIQGSNDLLPWLGDGNPDTPEGSPDAERIEKLIDNDVNTKYLVGQEQSWLDYWMNDHVALVSGYTITSANDAPERDPRSWELQGWDAGSESWVTLHTVTDQDMWGERFQKKSWSFDNTDQWFSKYRLNILAINGDSEGLMQMAELEILGEVVTAVQNDQPVNPIVFALKQNYPNPFNPTTTIDYSIAKSGLVTVDLYNMLGQKVKTLVNSPKAAGQYSISFNASDLSSGIYFYSIQAGDFNQTRKMMLMK